MKKDCTGCRYQNNTYFCVFTISYSALCPCIECIVKPTCDMKDKDKCTNWKKFSKKYKKEAFNKYSETSFSTRIRIGKKK